MLVFLLYRFFSHEAWTKTNQNELCKRTRAGQRNTLFANADRLALYRPQLNKCYQEYSIFRTTHVTILHCSECSGHKVSMRSQTTNERLEGRLSQTATVTACCISQTKSNFTRNGKDNMKLEHAKLPTMWITSLQNILHSQDLRVC